MATQPCIVSGEAIQVWVAIFFWISFVKLPLILRVSRHFLGLPEHNSGLIKQQVAAD
jgi:hypothetical protein